MERGKRWDRAKWSIMAIGVMLLLVGWAIGGGFIPTYTLGPVVDAPDSVNAGAGLYGTATDDDPPVTVTALLDGVTPLAGSPDTTSDEGTNSFCFPVPSDASGHFVLNTATNASGYSTTKTVTVRPN